MSLKELRITERQRTVLETTRLKLNVPQSLAYLRSQGFDVSDKTLWRERKKLQDLSLKRLYYIGQAGFQDQHIATIDEYEMGFKIMWQNVMRMRENPYKQNLMIKDIMMLKPYLSAYYEATKLIIQKPPPANVESNDDSKNKKGLEEEEKEEQPIAKQEDNNISTYRGNREEIGLSEAEREYRKQKEQRIF